MYVHIYIFNNIIIICYPTTPSQIFGLWASFEFLNSLNSEEISNCVKELKDYAIKELNKLEKVIIYNQNLSENVGIIITIH